MSDFTTVATTVTARKQHRCRVCNEAIEAGSAYVAWSGVFDGRWFRTRLHPECDAVSKDWDEDEWGAHFPGDTKRPPLPTPPHVTR